MRDWPARSPSNTPDPGRNDWALVAGPVICLGDIMVDIVATLPGPLALGSDVHAPIRYLGGGSAANTAAWLAVVGGPVGLIGRVGADAAGTQARAQLVDAGVIDHIQLDPVRATGTCIVLVNPDGERTMIPDPGANTAIDVGAVERVGFASDGHLHVSGYALLGGSRPAALVAMALTRAAGATLSVDAASAAPLARAGADAFLDWIGRDLLLFANAAEAQVLTGASDPAVGCAVLARRLGRAVVKDGARGAYWCDRTGKSSFSPSRPIEVVDTTGAGDAFAAAYLAAQTAGASPEAALRAANQLAAVVCGQVGGRPPAPLLP